MPFEDQRENRMREKDCASIVHYILSSNQPLSLSLCLSLSLSLSLAVSLSRCLSLPSRHARVRGHAQGRMIPPDPERRGIPQSPARNPAVAPESSRSWVLEGSDSGALGGAESQALLEVRGPLDARFPAFGLGLGLGQLDHKEGQDHHGPQEGKHRDGLAHVLVIAAWHDT